ncbi:hypothetical protein SBRY_70258 [Actinacidiphila bryophytorum]|uniref:Uncharacterized protein n=1 Tax=Actinacidiphila bryophytorum TaxID=1436133 RepID=A0A9W4MFY7_9ACTN|nr:hypothetical protein SBRY_70258 [Actinacidiphila bryophytorum]
MGRGDDPQAGAPRRQQDATRRGRHDRTGQERRPAAHRRAVRRDQGADVRLRHHRLRRPRRGRRDRGQASGREVRHGRSTAVLDGLRRKRTCVTR